MYGKKGDKVHYHDYFNFSTVFLKLYIHVITIIIFQCQNEDLYPTEIGYRQCPKNSDFLLVDNACIFY